MPLVIIKMYVVKNYDIYVRELPTCTTLKKH
jgi:hypothetical protein